MNGKKTEKEEKSDNKTNAQQYKSSNKHRQHLLDVVRSSFSIDCLLPTVRILNVMTPTFGRWKPTGCASYVTAKETNKKKISLKIESVDFFIANLWKYFFAFILFRFFVKCLISVKHFARKCRNISKSNINNFMCSVQSYHGLLLHTLSPLIFHYGAPFGAIQNGISLTLKCQDTN